MDWNAAVRAAFGGHEADDDVIEELAQHAASAFEAARADGASEEAAHREVMSLLRAWAGDDAIRRAGRAARGTRPRPPQPPPPATSALAGLGGDVRYACQMLRRQWGHTLVVLLTMALGIGATTVLFSVAYGVLVKPMPWPGAGRLVRLTETRQGSSRPARFFTNATYLAWNEHPTTIEQLAAWSADRVTLTGTGEPERIRIVEATPSLFTMLGAQPVLGHLFRSAAGGRPEDEQVVALSYGLWQQRFSGRPDVIGHMLRFDGTPYRVAAVMPAGFEFPDREVRAWIPLTVPLAPSQTGGGMLAMFNAIAKLRPGVTAAQAAAEATTRGRHAPDPGMVTLAVFGSRGPVQVIAVPLLDALTGEVRPALLVFLVAVGLLLATATANIASLQLARASGRRREIAIRLALGAGTGRLARQLLIESAVVGQAGGLIGLAMAAWLLRVLPVLLPADFPRRADVALDWRVALASIGLTLLVSLAFGLAPVLQARRVQLTSSLAEDGLAPVGGSMRSHTARARLMIMTGQIAVATVLLLGAALLSRSFVALLHADRGYSAANLLTAVLPLPDGTYTAIARADMLERMLERLEHTPGVQAAAVAARPPLVGSGEMLGAFPVPAREGEGTVLAHASIQIVSPAYFRALGIRVLEGRTFTGADSASAQPVLVVNRTFARQYLRAPAVGTRLPAERGEREVVGVVEDVKYGGVTDASQPEIYLALGQLTDGFAWDQPCVLARTTGDPLRLAGTLRAIVREQDASVAVESVMTMEDRVRASLAKPRLYTLLLGAFGLVAIAIAGVGLFGVLSYGVAQRARELGVRASVGATPWDIARLVLRQALAVTATGLALGVLLSAAFARPLETLLYGVSHHDVPSYAVVLAVLTVVAVVACLVPARRASRVDPVRVLR